MEETRVDKVFDSEIQQVSDFKFEEKVVSVFDDMVNRSVPFYDEIQRMITELAASHAKPNSSVFDLGCSTGTSMIAIDPLVPSDVTFVGIDDSPEMIERCKLKFEKAGISRPHQLLVGDINEWNQVQNASVVIMSLTLQFVRPTLRSKIVKQIYEGLNPGGCFILVEKVLTDHQLFNRDFIKYYYDYKRRNGYSELEISQKREALENVLIPYTVSENNSLLKDAGFEGCEMFFKWYNFSGLIAYKK
ncbi:tRNA (cmo5U34)-methyltransferase [Dyadobacter jejuensis]|uniref:Carboxy-S-adenosyl-L-methionine synthase n=1 Tax=Dyadobacter jejuensis TaxID=1082580 RepID=A0A316AB75_9BACT|nr:carboxy-S-adenosyl-L-methionine synthase CmoA [Dyadobacter jejuensis]PWJ54270.1 tRNA (cmo5U34)-methyltransferase [Dyadobacter jejuensis]